MKATSTVRVSDLVHDSSPHTEVVSWVGGEYACRGSGARHCQLTSTVRLDGICKHHVRHVKKNKKHVPLPDFYSY